MDEASKELENNTTSQPHLSVGYQKLSLNPSLVDQLTNRKPYLVNLALFEKESCEFVLNQTLAEKMVDLVLPSVNPTFLIESEARIA